MSEPDNNQMTHSGSPLAANQFPLLRRFSMISLLAMVIIATILVLLYRNDQLSEHHGIVAQNNEKAAIHLVQLLDKQIYALITSNEEYAQALPMNQNVGLISDALEVVRERDILKFKIFNQSGVTIYSSVKSEIGGTSRHPEKLAKALAGEVVSQQGFRETFASTSGELHDVYVASVYMPLNQAGKRIGAVEVYTDATAFFEHLNANTIRIPLIVFGAFVLLYGALFFSLFKADRAVAEWQMAAVRDINGRQHAEEKIRRLNEELESKIKERTRQLLEAQDDLVRKEKLAMLGQVAGSVGHELRNPLGVMNNAVYFLQTVLADADEITKEYLGIIMEEIARSERIVDALLDAVRTPSPNLATHGVAELINQIIRQCAVPASVTVTLDIPETVSPVRVDALQMQQAFRNLISNGVEAMPEGGELAIRATENRQAGTVTISVCDTGAGIAPVVLGKLFQPLVTTKARGIGLGLVVAKNLTQVNGGRIEVRSELGQGAIFSVILPGDYEEVIQHG
jgi:signal transduction histidine kinase